METFSNLTDSELHKKYPHIKYILNKHRKKSDTADAVSAFCYFVPVHIRGLSKQLIYEASTNIIELSYKYGVAENCFEKDEITYNEELEIYRISLLFYFRDI